MNNVFTLDAAGPRVKDEAIQHLQLVIEDCVRAAVDEVGVVGFQSFFGYHKEDAAPSLKAA